MLVDKLHQQSVAIKHAEDRHMYVIQSRNTYDTILSLSDKKRMTITVITQ